MEFRILGPVDIWREGRSVPIVGVKQRSLLAILVLNANRVVPSERLISALWGADVPTTGRRLLHKHVWALRRLLSDPALMSSTSAGYRLEIQPGGSDLDVFISETEASRAAWAAGDALESADRLRTALNLWRGPALGGTHPDLQLAECAALEERRLAALTDRIRADLSSGRHGELIGELRGLAAEHPGWEQLRGQLMLALHRVGRTAEALEEYRNTRRYLRDELGIEPGPELTQVHQSILAADPADRAGEASARNTRRQPFPTPRQLPSGIASFIGRTKSLEALDSLLLGGRKEGSATVSIAAITGTAGVGKTALAVHWGHRVLDHFPDGQLYVDLRGYSTDERMTSGQVLRRFLVTLGVKPEAIAFDPDEQAATLRSLLASRRMLIILDNAATSEQVRPLLPGSPTCLVLVTSRDDLRGLLVTHDVRTVPLGTLSPSDADALLTRLVEDDRRTTEPAALSELSRLCGYLPLALRIAAAHLAADPRLSVAALASRLRGAGRLETLAVEGDHQLAVRSAIDLSYRTLALEDHRLFRLLGLYPGPDFSVQAAAVLDDTTPTRAAACLSRLSRAHLVEHHGADRFRMHDLVREYAHERALSDNPPAERLTAIGRLYGWYLHRVDAAVRLLAPQLLRLPVPAADSSVFNDTADALSWLDAERANLVAAIIRGRTLGVTEPAGLLADAIRGYFAVRSDTTEWLLVARAALGAAEAAGDVLAQAAAHHSLAQAHYCRGDTATATDHLTHALKFSEQVGWHEGVATALGNLGNILADAGRLPEAATHISRAISKYGEIGDPTRTAVYLGNLGGVFTSMGQLEDAVRRHRQALTLLRQNGAAAPQAIALNNMGYVLQLMGHLDEAIGHLTEALGIYRDTDRINGQAICLSNLAAAYRDAGRFEAAVDHARRALNLIRETDDRYVEAEVLITLGSVMVQRGGHVDAIDHHVEALRIAREISSREHVTGALLGLATAHHSLGQAELARTHGWEAFRLAESCGYPIPMGQALTVLAAGYLLDDPGKAIELAERALILHRGTGHRLGVARTLVPLGQAQMRTGDVSAAIASWREAGALFTLIGSTEADSVRDLLDTVV
ncbi:BTAD domain-containing putative transcriptional regulator [Sphaerimonospora cavernae]|uniref:BTAD domain-containing putative transcriptional regulator n=1 Tax=Sphaerimonospora cavernae TaxID=1740611 RepID=A0ABV6UBC0_9ACTN